MKPAKTAVGMRLFFIKGILERKTFANNVSPAIIPIITIGRHNSEFNDE